MDDATTTPRPQPQLTALVADLTATGQRVAIQMAALRADLAAAEDRTAERVAAAEAKAARDLTAEKASRRRSQRRLLYVFAFDLVLTIVLATVLNGQAETNRRIADTNRRIQDSLAQNYATRQEQAATRVNVLCPLWTILVALASDPAQSPGTTPQQQDRARKIRDGYTTLGCLPPLSKP